MTVHDEFRIRLVERIPEGAHAGRVPVRSTTEPRVVPVCDCAEGARGLQLCPEPSLLRRPFVAATHVSAVAVENNHTPGPEIVGIVTLRRRTGRRTEVSEVALSVLGEVIMVAGRWAYARLVPAPRGCKAANELLKSAPLIDIISRCEDCSSNAIEQLRRHFVAGAFATRDVSSPDEHRVDWDRGGKRLSKTEHADRQQTNTYKGCQILSPLRV